MARSYSNYTMNRRNMEYESKQRTRSTQRHDWHSTRITLSWPHEMLLARTERSLEHGCNCVNYSFEKLPLKGGNSELMLRYVSVSSNSTSTYAVRPRELKVPLTFHMDSCNRSGPRLSRSPRCDLTLDAIRCFLINRLFNIDLIVLVHSTQSFWYVFKIPTEEFTHISTIFFILNLYYRLFYNLKLYREQLLIRAYERIVFH